MVRAVGAVRIGGVAAELERRRRRSGRRLCVGGGENVSEARQLIREAIEFHLWVWPEAEKKSLSLERACIMSTWIVRHNYALYADETLYGLASLTVTVSLACLSARVAFRG